MRLLLVVLTLFSLEQARCQNGSTDFAKNIEKLREEKKLTAKSYPDKMFVGLLTGYYDTDSLVLINSLTDAEDAGTETMYYIRNGLLSKLYIMFAQFDSHREWTSYSSKHKSADNCKACHSKPNCTVTIIDFTTDTTVKMTDKGQLQKITPDEKARILSNVLKTSKALQIMLKELE